MFVIEYLGITTIVLSDSEASLFGGGSI